MSAKLLQETVCAAFEALWHAWPTAVAKAPGRVNLIGEHIDYEGYGVMPMAIEQACCVAVGWKPASKSPDSSDGTQQGKLLVANTQPQLYPPGVVPLDPQQPLTPGTPPWLIYVQAAYMGCIDFAASKSHPVGHQQGLCLMVGSSIPPAAGLSSSSALVVATALALLDMWRMTASPAEVAELTCRCERYVGTQGGGMDQAVSLMAQAGRAMHVEFNPVRASPVPLPPGLMVVVANSLTPSAKAETASHRFNLRVLECRLAAMLLAASLSAAGGPTPRLPAEDGSDWRDVHTLQQVEHALLQHSSSDSAAGGLPGTAAVLVEAVRRHLPQPHYTLTQVADSLGISQQQLLQHLPEGLQAAAAAASQLHLQQRAHHVFTEALRVLSFKCVCLDQALTPEQQLQQLGKLLNKSHTSCAELYQCSCEELDTLVSTARAAGALGARLTGAGWGGCIVALVRHDQAATFMQELREQYYQPLVTQGRASEHEVQGCVFASSPSAGASVSHPDVAVMGEAAAAAAGAAAVAIC